MEHLAVLAEAGSLIQADDLPGRSDAAVSTNGWPTHLMSKAYHTAKEAVLTHFEREYLANLVARSDRNMSKAARLAGIDRTTLYRLLEKHQVTEVPHSNRPDAGTLPPGEFVDGSRVRRAD
jgi:DNA-binding NtrC family response regulator